MSYRYLIRPWPMKQHSECDSQDGFTDPLQSFEKSVRGMLSTLDKAHETLLECNAKIDANMKHLEVTFKPPTGFVKR